MTHTDDDSDLKTLFKIRTGRRGRELGWLLGILAGVFLAIGAVGAAQVWLCLGEKPGMTVGACLMPFKTVRLPLR